MRTVIFRTAVVVGLAAAVGVGVWNAAELRSMREQLAAERVEPTAPTQPTPDDPRPGDDYVVEPTDVLSISIRLSGAREGELENLFQVKPDGCVFLGKYGSLYVAGTTVRQVKTRLEEHLGRQLVKPEVEVDVVQFNSKKYYVVTDGGGAGERVYQFPCTGSETVLDAIALIDGLSKDTDRSVWVIRTSPAGAEQTLPVDWKGIVGRGHTRTNYQILPDDRLHVELSKQPPIPVSRHPRRANNGV